MSKWMVAVLIVVGLCVVAPARADEGEPNPPGGCPARIVVTDKGLDIVEAVQFETNKAVIKAASLGLLDDVAKCVSSHPEMLRIEVSCHTDNVGDDMRNQKLSDVRAESVVRHLVLKGVDRSRLVARGYGQTRPIDTNDTANGRARNRRVEFTLVP